MPPKSRPVPAIENIPPVSLSLRKIVHLSDLSNALAFIVSVSSTEVRFLLGFRDDTRAAFFKSFSSFQ